MVEATEVFTPTDVPTITYVERASRNYEDDLRNAFKIPKMIVSISGPSKSGKTVLVSKVVAPDNLIHIYGASIKNADDLWQHVITWMGGPIQRSVTTGSNFGGQVSGSVGGSAGIPLLAKGKVDIAGNVAAGISQSSTETYAPVNVDDIVTEIGGSDYVVFIDDFHYIDKPVRDELGKQIKAAAERGVRICTASVPHRADDVVRSNTELRGRVAAYVAAGFGSWNLRTGAAFSWNTIATDRIVAFPGFADQTHANYGADETHLFGELGYGMAFGRMAVEPFAGLDWVHLATQSFTESGGAGASNHDDIGYTTLGARVATRDLLPNGMVLTPHASLAYQHAFGNVTGTGIEITGVPLARDSALLRVGADLQINREATFGLFYPGELASNAQDHSINGRFVWRY